VTTLNEDAIALLEHRGWRLLAMDPVRGRKDRLRMHCYAAPREPSV
jgi:hypothetical protein